MTDAQVTGVRGEDVAADSGSGGILVNVVCFSGVAVGSFASASGEKVEQFIERLGLDAAEFPLECVSLVHEDRLLPGDLVLQDCGVPSGATLTVVLQQQSRLHLVAFACGDWRQASFAWADETSPAIQLCTGTVGWCREFADGCMNGAYGAVCSLQNPSQLQGLVDNGDVSRDDAVKAVISCFIRSLMATGSICTYGDSMEGIGEASDHAVTIEMLREQLPRTACGMNLLSDPRSQVPEKFDNLSKRHLNYVLEKDEKRVESAESRIKEGLEDTFQLEALEEMDLNVWESADDALVGWRRFLELRKRACKCSGSARWCDECCKEPCISFLKSVHNPGNVWFQIVNDDMFCRSPCLIYSFGVGVFLEDEVCQPDKLPTYYVFQWASTD